MDFQWFLVAILLPVGKWASLPLEQMHCSCCCLLSCAPNCWQCPFPKASRGRMGNEPGELLHHLLNQKTLQSCKIVSVLSHFNSSLESNKVLVSPNRFTVAFEAGLFGGFGSSVCFSEKQGTLPKLSDILVAFHPLAYFKDVSFCPLQCISPPIFLLLSFQAGPFSNQQIQLSGWETP